MRQRKIITIKCDESCLSTSAFGAQKSGRVFAVGVVVAVTIPSILTMMALSLARVSIQREREKQLRHALSEIRRWKRTKSFLRKQKQLVAQHLFGYFRCIY